MFMRLFSYEMFLHREVPRSAGVAAVAWDSDDRGNKWLWFFGWELVVSDRRRLAALQEDGQWSPNSTEQNEQP